MKITKKQEEEILKVYYAYWDAYLQGNTRAMSLLMDENCQVIGSGQGEVFSNRKTAIKYYKSTADQVAGKAEMRNRKINMSPAGSQILIREESDFFVMMDSVWTFYWQARISTLFAKSDRKWKIIHQHGSLPDARTSGGEQVNTDKIRAENVRLKDAVKRRTIELEQKNRELEIEAALERVRARTMAMQSSNELKEVVANLFDGLKSLGVDPSVCNIALVDKKTNDTDVWTAHQTDHGILTYKIFIQHFDHPFRTKLLDSFLKKIPFSIHELSGDLKKSYVKYLLEHVDYSNAPDEVTKSNEKLADMEGGIVLSAAYMNYGFLIISRSSAISIDESDILQRFARIFEQTYTRFLDLKQAETQAREGQIEAALERVRSRTMGMQKSEELKEVIQVVYEQFVHLNILIEHTGFIMDYKARDDMHIWLADQHEVPSEVTIPYFDCAHWNSFNEAKKKGIDFFANHLTFEEKNRFYQDLFKLIPGVPGETLEYYFSCPGLAISTVLLENVGLYIENFSGIPYSDEENNTLMRFGKVFQQTYTRFLDLQKAEAQTREAKIEMALEKIRSRTMAMQHSDELPEAANLLFLEVQALGIPAWSSGFNVLAEDKKTCDSWMSSEGAIQEPFTLFFTEEASFIEMYNFLQSDESFFVQELEGKAIEDHYNYMRKIPKLGVVIKKLEDAGISLPTYQINHLCKFTHGFLLFITYEPVPDAHDLFKRFTTVFEQTYTRFLDLQKAEAQAREAQIEASLERVRSRAMAIRKSDELDEVIQIIFQELGRLEIDLMECSIAAYDTNPKDLIYWSAGPIGSAQPSSVKLQYIDHPLLVDLFNDFESGVQYRSGEFSGEFLKTWWDRIFTETDFKYAPAAFIESWKKIKNIFYSQFAMKHGFLEFLGGAPLPDDKVQILKRFTNVVDLTYTRYDDVVKAEAQAREAQIENALEKVRSRSLAMHKSDELADLSFELVKQVKALGVSTWFCAFNIYDDDQKGSLEWGSNAEGTYPNYRTPREGIFLRYYEAGQSGETLLINEIGENECAAHYEYLCSLPGVGEQLLKMKDSGISFPDSQIDHVAYFKYGYIIFITFVPAPEAHDIFKRFAKVFEQTYTRFLDLQKAEAQNKIIQAENERKTQELEEARQLQLSMLPKELPKLSNLDIAVYMQTATEVGGDYYDFQVGIDGTLTTIIGDATGHGMKAGTVVTITKSLFNSMAASENILDTFDKISQVIKGMKFRQLAMCLLMMKIRGNRLSMSSAAMPPALIYRVKNKSVEEIFLQGMPLGTMKKFPYKKIESHLNIGDRILLYSDGLPELANENNEMYGYDRIKTEYHSVGDKEPEAIVDHLKNSASLWANGKKPDDDVTFVVIKVK